MTILNLSLICNISYIISGIAHRGSWRKLGLESCALRSKGHAEGTWFNKISHLRQYVIFCSYYQVPDFPIHLGILLRFIAFLGRGSLAYKSATNILSNITFFASLLSPPHVKVFDAVLYSISLRGLEAKLSRSVHQKFSFYYQSLM